MIILHVANFDRKHAYRAMYNCDHKLRNGLTRAGHAVYEFSDRDVARDSAPFSIRSLGVSAANAKLLSVVRTLRPDLLLLGHADIIGNDTLQDARSICPALKIAYYNVDPLFVASNNAAIRLRVGLADTIYITTGGQDIKPFTAGITRAFFMPNPVDSSLETGRAFEKSDQPHDVVFFTVRSHAQDARAQFMNALKDKLPQVQFGLYGIGEVASVFGAEYLAAMQNGRMAVNLSKTCGHIPAPGERNFLYSSDRLAQVTGQGLLTFMDRSSGLETLYNKDEAVFFDTMEDLAQKIAFYKSNDAERKRIAANGWRKAHGVFNSTRIAQYLLETTFGLPLSEPYGWQAL